MKTIKRDKGIKGKPTPDINTCNKFNIGNQYNHNYENMQMLIALGKEKTIIASKQLILTLLTKCHIEEEDGKYYVFDYSHKLKTEISRESYEYYVFLIERYSEELFKIAI